jgi:hypothetical protein
VEKLWERWREVGFFTAKSGAQDEKGKADSSRDEAALGMTKIKTPTLSQRARQGWGTLSVFSHLTKNPHFSRKNKSAREMGHPE